MALRFLTIGIFLFCIIFTMILSKNNKPTSLLKLKEIRTNFLEIQLPPALIWMERVIALLSGAASVGMVLIPQYFYVAVFVPCMFLMLTAFLFACGMRSWRLILLDDCFVYRTFLRKTYRICYSDITSYKLTNRFLHIKTKKKHFYMSTSADKLPIFFHHMRVMFGEISSTQTDYDFIM